MQLAMIGLGRMGGNMVRRLVQGGREAIVYDSSADAVKQQGIEFVDVGTSGGIWGLELGYCLMIGGSPVAFQHCEPLFRNLAPPDGYAHVGPSGAGHYVKMVHNGIEYGMLQAYAEGYEILHASQDFEA